MQKQQLGKKEQFIFKYTGLQHHCPLPYSFIYNVLRDRADQ